MRDRKGQCWWLLWILGLTLRCFVWVTQAKVPYPSRDAGQSARRSDAAARLSGALNVNDPQILRVCWTWLALEALRLDFSIGQSVNAGKDCLGVGGHGMQEEPGLLHACSGLQTSIGEAIAASPTYAGFLQDPKGRAQRPEHPA